MPAGIERVGRIGQLWVAVGTFSAVPFRERSVHAVEELCFCRAEDYFVEM
jgi:hypothetical protein